MITIRKLTTNDATALSLLDNLVFNNNITPIAYNKLLENNSFTAYGIFQETTLICFITTLDVYPDSSDIISFATTPVMRRQGYAKNLLNYVINLKFEQGYQAINLEVRKSNTTAIGLYEKLGFTSLYPRLNYYDNGEDAIVMQKKFTKEEKK